MSDLTGCLWGFVRAAVVVALVLYAVHLVQEWLEVQA